MSAGTMFTECRRCGRHDIRDWHHYTFTHPAEAERDCPYVFNGYCSAICQALDLRESLIEANRYDPVSGVLK